jgi:hypothetical protein
LHQHNYKKLKHLLFFVVLIFLASGVNAQKDTLKYIFLGHTYQFYTAGDKVDERFKNLDLSEYDGVWHGGDLCSESLMNYPTLIYIDSIFHLTAPNTHWALGNHDSRNPNWIWLEELTGKKTYYTSHYKGITYIVLNTGLTPYDCEQLDDQYRIIVNVCDTIQKSSHLILIMHHGIWEGVPGLPSPYTYAQSNLIHYNFNCYSEESTFANEIYPRLVEVKKRGIEVISILGDMGAKKIDFTSTDGLHFLGTGLNRSKYQDPVDRENSPQDWAIIFKHVPATGWMDWVFVDFDVLTSN